MRNLYIIGILIVFNSVGASAITCSDARSGEIYELEVRGNISSNVYGVYKFDNNAPIDLTVSRYDGIEKYSGNLVLQNYGAVTKKGRMAYYVFKVKSNRLLLLSNPERAFAVSILGIDVFGDEKTQCTWL